MNNDTGRSLWLRWVLANGIGELLGLGGTFAIGLVLFTKMGEPQNALQALGMAALMTSSGLLEGTVVGLAQWAVMRRPFPRLGRGVWVGATIAGALVAWALGSVPMTVASLGAQAEQAAGPEPPQWIVLLAAGGMGLAAGAILGWPQWRALRRIVWGAGLWIPANSLAWAVGMPIVFSAVDLAQQSGSTGGAVATMAAAVALTGAVVGAIHGLALVVLASRARGVDAAS